jgi:peptidyl-prolyl cis-trans isomerase C
MAALFPRPAGAVIGAWPHSQRDCMTLRQIPPLAILVCGLSIGVSPAYAQDQTTDPAQPAQPAQPPEQPATGQPAATAPAPEPPPETVVAIVNGKKITRADVIASAKQLPAEYQSQINQVFPALIDRQIDLTLLSDEGAKQNLVEDPVIKQQLAELTENIIRQAVLDRYLQAQMTEAAIKARYDKFVGGLPKQQEVKARHILVEKEEDAKAIIVQLDGGADFSAIAKEKSKDPGSGPKGGELGYFVAGQMVPEFSDAAFKLEKGQYTKAPVKSQFGWHIIIVDDKRDKQPPTFEEARGTIEQIMSNELVTGYVAELRKAASVQRFNPDGTSVAPPEGGQPTQQ